MTQYTDQPDQRPERAVGFDDAATAAGFTAVPNAILQLGLSAYAQLALVHLLSYAWQDDECWPGQTALAERMGLSKPTVIKALAELEAAGLVESRRRGHGQTNVYRLLIRVEVGRGGSKPRLLQESMSFTSGVNEVYTNKTQGKRHKEKDLSSSASELVREVFDYWQQVMEKPKAKLTSDRRAKVKARLAEGYTVADLKAAIDGCRATPHNMGDNDRRRPFNDLTLICRSGSHVERFRDSAEPAANVRRDRHRLGQTTIDDSAVFARATGGTK